MADPNQYDPQLDALIEAEVLKLGLDGPSAAFGLRNRTLAGSKGGPWHEIGQDWRRVSGCFAYNAWLAHVQQAEAAAGVVSAGLRGDPNLGIATSFLPQGLVLSYSGRRTAVRPEAWSARRAR